MEIGALNKLRQSRHTAYVDAFVKYGASGNKAKLASQLKSIIVAEAESEVAQQANAQSVQSGSPAKGRFLSLHINSAEDQSEEIFKMIFEAEFKDYEHA